MSSEPLKKHPGCNGNVKRLVSGGTGLIFKGSGFYLTDYKNNSGKDKKNKNETKKTDNGSGNSKKKKEKNKIAKPKD
tara:strand:- start:966 stop:1196 length:231 start_codon:yes stop_codon:yes gene_type:complete